MTKDEKILEIARAAFGVCDLESRGSDSADFIEAAVWDIRKALQQAYEAGAASQQKRVPSRTIVMDVLERAEDVDDRDVVAACRRLIKAHRLGVKKHADQNDADVVWAFSDQDE